MTTTNESLDMCSKLDDLPPLGEWRLMYDLSLAGASFVLYFLSRLGTQTVARDDKYWELDERFNWEFGSGVCYIDNDSEWQDVKAELNETPHNFLSFFEKPEDDMPDDVSDDVFIRPTAALMELFGLSLETYEIVARLDTQISFQSDSWMRLAKVVTPEEMSAVELWISRGGLARVANSQELRNLVKLYSWNAEQH